MLEMQTGKKKKHDSFRYIRIKTIVLIWSGLRDLNPRSPGPKPGAIPNFAKPGYSVEDIAVVVKYVVKEIIPHFQETFKSGYWGKLGRNRGVCNISGSRTNSVLQLPKKARCQLRCVCLFSLIIGQGAFF